MSFLNPKAICPKCRVKLNGFTAMTEGTIPKAGDLTICVHCKSILEFTEDMLLITASQDAIDQAKLDLAIAMGGLLKGDDHEEN